MRTGRTPRFARRNVVAITLAIALATSGCLKPSAVGVPYSPLGHSSTVADIYPALTPNNVGTIIFVHGGGFMNGSRDDIMRFGGPVVGQTLRGWGVVAVGYRSAAYPAAIHDLADAIRFVRSDAGKAMGLSDRKIVLVGHSAGAAIVTNLALTANDGAAGPFGALPKVDAWISAGGLLDFTMGGPESAHVAWQTGWDQNASPINHLDARDPVGLILHGAKDPISLIGHALTFIAKSRAVGHPTLFKIFNDNTSCSGHSPICEQARPTLEGFLDAIAR